MFMFYIFFHPLKKTKFTNSNDKRYIRIRKVLEFACIYEWDVFTQYTQII